MDDQRLRARSYPVAQSAPHQILVCKACRHKGQDCMPGFQLLKRLRAAISAAGFGDDFEVSGTACIAGCAPDQRAPCVVGYRATGKAAWLFGDIDPDQPLDDLVDFARTSVAQGDGGCNGRDLPVELSGHPSGTTLTRIPAAMIVTREGTIQ
ncbi:MAG: DUF1636 domain-containing protein [Tabrizicola sp.]